MKKGDAEYNKLLAEYFEQQGGIEGNCMAARWAWKVEKQRAFDKLMREKGLLTE